MDIVVFLKIFISIQQWTLLHALERLVREIVYFFLIFTNGQKFCVENENSKQMIEKLAKTDTDNRLYHEQF